MREIGGYMDLERYQHKEYYTDLLRVNTVRNAIALIIKEKEYHTLYIPKYLCSCIQVMLEHNKIDFKYYNVDKNLNPLFEYTLSDREALLLVNYFGQYSTEDLRYYQRKYKNIIVDNTQSFFQSPVDSIDTVYTCRKYFGVPDGAYLHLTQTSRYYDELTLDVSYQRMEHLLGRFENNASMFYSIFQQNDDLFEFEDIKKMSLITKNLLCSIDYDFVKETRFRNCSYLHERLKSFNYLKINQENCLYMYPFLHKNGHKIKKDLISKKIYVPTLWPNVLEENFEDSFEYYLAKNLVLFPIDQRYSVDDMQYMLNQLTFLEGSETNDH